MNRCDREFGTKTAELAPETSRDSLNNSSLNRYRDYMARFNPNASYNRFDEVEFLEKLRIMENGKCSYAGLLMFGKRDVIEKHFADFRVDLLEVPGTSYSDAKQCYTFRIEEQENLWEYYFECFARLKQKVDVQFSLTAEGFGQELSPGLESIREALVNMLMHTDYFSPACPRVRIFTNHIEFYNSGGLPKPFEELKRKDISLPRNPILAKLFRMVKLAENAGFGFDKIDENWKAYNSTTPDYQIKFDSVVVGFQMEAESELGDKLGETVEETEVKIILLIKINPNITAKQIEDATQLSRRGVEYNIDKLKKEGKLKRIGPAKGGHWVIIDKTDSI